MELNEIKANPKRKKKLFQPAIGMTTNFYSCAVISKDNNIKIVKLRDDN